MHALQRPLTYDDLYDMPDDGNRRELIGGELIVNPSPRRAHQIVSAFLTWFLWEELHIPEKALVVSHPVDLYIGPNDVVQPDLVAIEASRQEINRPEGMIVEPPDIVIEIISPSSQRTDRVGKMALNARFGVPEYWIIDPEARTFVMNTLADRVYESVPPGASGGFESRAFLGLRIDQSDVFFGIGN